MIKKYKIMILTALIATPILANSCVNHNYSPKLELSIDKNLDIINPKVNEAQIKTKKILENLLSYVFLPTQQVQKVNFLEDQTSKNKKKEFVKKYKEIKDKNGDITKLLNENWYFVLTNLNLFQGEFERFLTFPPKNGGQHSDLFLKRVEGQPYASNMYFNDSLLDDLIVGDESLELPNTTILYLKKDKMVFRLIIDNAQTAPHIDFNGTYWGFARSKTDVISLKLISDIVHSAYVHGYQEGYDRFENDIVKRYRYSYPAIMHLVLREEVFKNDKS